jgi:hypothetical protein
MSGIVRQQKLQANLIPAGTNITATLAAAFQMLELGGYRELLVTLEVTSADTGGTYNVYLAMAARLAGVATAVGGWDVVSFAQVASAISTNKIFQARVFSQRFAEVTSATPGIAAEPPAIMETDTAGSNQGYGTLAAGKVRHGPFGDWIGVYVVAAGTITTGLTFSVDIQASR